MNIFYINLKDYIKNKIIKDDRSNELAKMIKTAIHINNHIYKW
jgi:hypothetical protein